ncbi:hypothetical protein G4B88_007485 [Cannabis sativa]|uniref:Uncharacterized protein n=1 Tax=Cannabis sativa TaxID=3483 RepID=A0A7J6HBK0_CANSA|nr:hypothetical protein G4B88_007485 [Cannabis sativa]
MQPQIQVPRSLNSNRNESKIRQPKGDPRFSIGAPNPAIPNPDQKPWFRTQMELCPNPICLPPMDDCLSPKQTSLEKTQRFRFELRASPNEHDMTTLNYLSHPLKIRHICVHALPVIFHFVQLKCNVVGHILPPLRNHRKILWLATVITTSRFRGRYHKRPRRGVQYGKENQLDPEADGEWR